MDPIARVVKMLEDESPRKRIAAAVVLGELRVKDPAVVSHLVALAKDPLDAYAEAAIEALGQIGSTKALPVLLEALGRGRELSRLAGQAIAALGPEVLPDIKAKLEGASPEIRAALSQLLPAVGGKQSFEMALEGMRGQTFDAVNRVALSVRQEAKVSSEAEKRVMRTQVEKFLEKKKTQEDEPALRGALKVLGFLEISDAADTLLSYVGKKHSVAVRVEAITALRFALVKETSKKVLRRLMELLVDEDVLVGRSARDTLTVLKLGPEFSEELAELAEGPLGEVALWAIERLAGLAAGNKVATQTLVRVAQGSEHARVEAAAKLLALLPRGESLLVEALCATDNEGGAQALCEALMPKARELKGADLKALEKAGAAGLTKSLSMARRQLEPLRLADPQAWAKLLRSKATALSKKDEARSDALWALLVRSQVASPEDRYAHAVRQLVRGAHDVHPAARARDSSLLDLDKLRAEGFPLAARLLKEKGLSDEARFYVGFHFAESNDPAAFGLGGDLLEALSKKGKGKLAKAAKNKLKLLER